MKIGIDIDGVIADFVGSFLPKLNKICDCNFHEIVSHNFRNNISVDINAYDSLWNEEVIEGKIYKILKPINGAIEALNRLSQNHVINIISSRGENSRKITENWLLHNNIPFSSLELVQNKRDKVLLMMDCDLIIEDELEIARILESLGKQVILFDYPWTKECIKTKRVNNWDEILRIIE